MTFNSCQECGGELFDSENETRCLLCKTRWHAKSNGLARCPSPAQIAAEAEKIKASNIAKMPRPYKSKAITNVRQGPKRSCTSRRKR